MARPVVNTTAEEAYAALGPWTGPDAAQDYPLLRLVAAVTVHLDEVNQLVRDTDEPGWSSVVDADRAKASGLGWLGQFVGVDVPANFDVVTQRQVVRDAAGFRRGSKAAIAGAARKHLTGTKAVQIIERDGSPYRFTVRTFGAETPDVDLVRGELLKAKPAGLLMTYEVITGQTYGDLAATGDTYAELAAEYPTYFDMTTSVPPVI